MIKSHVLLEHATVLGTIDEAMAARLEANVVEEIVASVPDSWLAVDGGVDQGAVRAAYTRYLIDRLSAPRAFVEEALNVR
jgi:hypothetical protein